MDNKKRRYIYGIATALLPLLVIHGIVEDGELGLWIAVLGAALVPQLAMQNTPKKDPKRVRKSADE